MRLVFAFALLAFTGCATTAPMNFAPATSSATPSVEPATERAAAAEPTVVAHALPAEYAPVFDPQGSSVRPTYEEYQQREQRAFEQRWAPGQAVLQGYIGAAQLDEIRRTGGNLPPIDGSSDSLSQYPIIGGGAQWKLAGRRVDFGIEGMFNIAWRSGGTAFASGGGGLTVAVKVDLWMVDFYGGPFLSIPLGRKARAYGGLGPMMTFASYDQNAPTGANSGNSTGFGTGVYGRFGIEFETWKGTFVGFGARYQDNTIDLNSMGDLDVQGWQYFVSVTEGF